jgi:hypothetical protein
MRFQPEIKKHETDLKELRAERRSEDSRLTQLKTRLQDNINRRQPTLFAVHTDGHVNVA